MHQVLTGLPFSLTVEQAMDQLSLDESYLEEFEPIYQEAMERANPKFIYDEAPVGCIERNQVDIGGQRFRSQVLAVNLKGVERVYPYVGTCGRELYELSLSKQDPLERYWVDAISERVLSSALGGALERLQGQLGGRQLYAMNPGSLMDWPLGEQRPLFALLGDVRGLVGVELTDSCLMLPVKSVSGLLFQSEEHYTNCKLCPRDGCPNRRDAFDPQLFREKYQMDV